MMHTLILSAPNGAGVPVVMLHGWGANIELMKPLAQRLAPLGYDIHLLDLPGFGQTAPPPAAWGVPDYAACVLDYVNGANLSQFHLIGHSFGGRISLYLGAEHPDRLLKLALIDSAGVPNKQPPIQRARLTAYKAIRDALYGVGAKGLADRLRAWYGKRFGSADFNAAGGVMRDTFLKVVNQNLLPFAARIKAPTLLLWGEDDQATPLWQAQVLEKTIPDAGLVTFPGAGHYSYLDKPADTIRVLDYFFKH
ncbi:MAG: alpha/beta hydrolase [Anaerolinea sp.]|nr:alpha/beta hydrolase [Anaerolinea sp.]